MINYLKIRIKESVSLNVILIIYILLCLSSSIYFFIISQSRNAIMSLCFLLFVPLMYIVEYFLKLRIVPLFASLLFLLAFGAILGTCYELYTIIPFFDLILHGMAGLIFSLLGFSIMRLFLNDKESKKSFFGCLIFGFVFSLAIAVIWELFEYATSYLGFDMLEDSIINNIQSYLLSGSHSEVVKIEGITHTIIYYGNGESLTIQGYLDIGLLDTIYDMIICLVGAVIYLLVTIFSYYKYPKINEMLIPIIIKE